VLEVEIDEQKELIQQLMTTDREMKQHIQLLQQVLDKCFSEAVVNAARLREVESQLAEIQPLQSSETPTLQQPTSSKSIQTEQLLSSKSIQTEQSPTLEVEINEQKELNRQLMTRDRDMKQYIQLLQQELNKRFNEAVVHAARLREVESQLAEIQPLQSSETPTPQQLVDEPHYKSRYSHFYINTINIVPVGLVFIVVVLAHSFNGTPFLPCMAGLCLTDALAFLCPVTDILATVAQICMKFCIMVHVSPGQIFIIFSPLVVPLGLPNPKFWPYVKSG